MLFAIRYGFRQWRSHLKQYLLLLVGFALFAMLLSLNLATAPALFRATPSWVNNNAYAYATVGLGSPKGTLVGTSLDKLYLAAKAPGVVKVVHIGQNTSSFRIGAKTFHQNITFVDPNFVQALGIKGFSKREDFNQVAFISHAFERQAGLGSLVGKTLLAMPQKFALHIVGYIPNVLTQLPHMESLVWVSSNNQSAFIDLGLPPSISTQKTSLIKKEIAKKMPIYFGVALLKEGYHATALKAFLQKSERRKLENKNGGNVYSNFDNFKNQVVEGINFAPAERRKMHQQWWVIWTLSVIFGVINILNLLSHGLNQFLKRQGEFATRIAVGANSAQLCKQVFCEQLPLLLPALVLGWGAAFMAGYYSLHSQLWTLPVSANAMLLAMVVVTLAMMLSMAISTSLPLLGLLKKSQFSRAKAQDATPMLRRLSWLNLGAQLGFASIALLFAFAMLNSQWQVRQKEQFGAALSSWHLAAEDTNKNPVTPLQVQATLGPLADSVALSSGQFVSPISFPSPAAVAVPDFNDKPNISTLAVSSSFFKVVHARMLAGGNLTRQGVVLNQAAASALGLAANASSIGKTLFLKKGAVLGFADKQAVRVEGIVENLPHYGVLNKAQPMIYGLIDNLKTVGNLSFVVPAASQAAVLARMTQFTQNNGGIWTFSADGNIKVALEHLNRAMNQMVLMALVLGGLVSLLSISSLYNQLEAQLKMRERKLGIMLAVGARFYHLLKLIGIELVSIAAVVWLLLTMLIGLEHHSVERGLHTDLANPAVVAMVAVLLFAVLLCCSLWILGKYQRKPIRDLL
ncbi:FtsX-like permease family protein [Gallaecimonas mangrovi]|uniref:FtsX-like permease family protein n=1 Tax=Gallaecimonas mangrovi TaxID=2291597 RepID=UPI0018686BEC|nr:FtsX-like permease family protein [Gallaecimonas mangrovi]